ncbi:MAG TPA: hypothetical protein VMR81_04970 [Patescibacteria group bacterium]|nr:hypothetical protein [Patescibacteria group bacterium]
MMSSEFVLPEQPNEPELYADLLKPENVQRINEKLGKSSDGANGMAALRGLLFFAWNAHRVVPNNELAEVWEFSRSDHHKTHGNELVWANVSRMRKCVPGDWRVYDIYGDKAYIMEHQLDLDSPYIPIGFRNTPSWVYYTARSTSLIPLFNQARHVTVSGLNPDITLNPALGRDSYSLLELLAKNWESKENGIPLTTLADEATLSMPLLRQNLNSLRSYLTRNQSNWVCDVSETKAVFKPAFQK